MTFTWTDSFETDFGNWNNVTGDQHDWTRVTGSTPSSGTGPSAASDGTTYLLCETSSPVASDDEFWLESNVIDGSQNVVGITWEEHMAGAAMDDAAGNAYLVVEAFKNSTWTEIYRQTGQNGATADGLNWQSKSITNIDNEAGGPYDNADLKLRYRFHVSSGGSVFQNDCSLDLIVVTGTERNAYEQEGFRFRNDDGSESAATWRQNQDVNDTADQEETVRLRILTDASGNPGAEAATLQYKRTDEGASEWRDV